jgi:Lrp/AsnC family transcriptional regulator
MTLFVSVRTTRHAVKWLEDLRRMISDIPEIVEAWRLTGEVITAWSSPTSARRSPWRR